MKKIIIILFAILSAKAVNAQCPPGAYAIHTIYVRITFINPSTTLYDTSCVVTVDHYPASSKVYIYNTSAVLVDSLITDASGYGYLSFLPGNCLTYSVGISAGTAVCGTCTANISTIGLLPIKIKSFAAITSGNKATLWWQLEQEQPGTRYSLQASNNIRDFSTIYTATANAVSLPGKQYQFVQSIETKRFYRLMIQEPNAAVEYSAVITALPKGYAAMDVWPTAGNGSFSVNLSENFIKGEIRIFNVAGNVIKTHKITAAVSNITLGAGKGLFYVKALAPDGNIVVKTIAVQ